MDPDRAGDGAKEVRVGGAAARGVDELLCQRFGISRKTGYKMLARHAKSGLPGLADGSRAPKVHPNQTPPEKEAAIRRVRKAHPTWGSKQILWGLDRERPDEAWPARSTVDEILKRAGVVEPRGRRPRRQPSSSPRVEAAAPNDVRSMDYKGWFRVGDGTRCDPLMVNEVHSRASLVSQAMVSPKSADVRRRLETAFHAFGLPRLMLSDGGPPFGSNGLGRLSRLGVWLVRLGVIQVLIEPGRPDQNGRHERFHETLKEETSSPPKSSIRAQKGAFDVFQQSYNEERPHEALGMKPPAEVYELSPRSMSGELAEHSYGKDFEARRVRQDGRMKWDGQFVFVGEAFAGEVVGLCAVDDDLWLVHLGPLSLGVLHARSRTIVPLEGGVTHVPGCTTKLNLPHPAAGYARLARRSPRTASCTRRRMHATTQRSRPRSARCLCLQPRTLARGHGAARLGHDQGQGQGDPSRERQVERLVG